MGEHLNFTEFTDFLLVRLYQLESVPSERPFPDLRAIAAELREPVPQKWIRDAVRVLHGRGLVEGHVSDHTVVCEGLSPEGRLYVEQRDHETDVIKSYLQRPTNFVFVTGDGNQVAVDVDGSVNQLAAASEAEAEALALLAQIVMAIGNDPSLSATDRSELFADVASIRTQLGKRELNTVAVLALLDALGRTASIRERAAHVRREIEGLP